ncbi:c-type cytochrome [Fervidibacillus halotolerans]|uniref:C-type cytochrome n=1 Tax=Fervidibacillus halotolerans TaxID=2980027 RepID=A0A9E8M0D6_9BACI|nr:c-type cytochrome [Fervidibacillus halotolerans]WAA12009.1 c-type cytochrome [Fervidibacillus halotolerans]
MKKRNMLLIGLLSVGLLSACGGGNDSTENVHSSDLSGEELYMQSCSSCHGGDLKSGYAPDLDKIGSKFTAEEIEDIIVNGYKSMPKGILKGDDAKKVAEWLAEQK